MYRRSSSQRKTRARNQSSSTRFTTTGHTGESQPSRQRSCHVLVTLATLRNGMMVIIHRHMITSDHAGVCNLYLQSAKTTTETTFRVSNVLVQSEEQAELAELRKAGRALGAQWPMLGILGCPPDEMTHLALSAIRLTTNSCREKRSVRCNTMSSLRILPRFAILGQTLCVCARAWLATTRGAVPRPSGALSTPRTDGHARLRFHTRPHKMRRR